MAATKAFGIVHHFPGGTKEQYEATLAAVHPTRQALPSGQIFHAAGQSAGGWTIIAVHESKESWERFRDGTCHGRLIPARPVRCPIGDVVQIHPNIGGKRITTIAAQAT